jgi:RNA-directed DNA polymerase
MSARQALARNLAAAFLAGPWSAEEMAHNGALALGRRSSWLRRLAGRVHTTFAEQPARRNDEALAAFIGADAGFRKAWPRCCRHLQFLPRQIFWATLAMAPAAGPPASWPVPALATAAALADWLGLTPTELDWFADCHGHEAAVRPGPLRHYTYRWLGGAAGKRRLLEVPKERLKAIQRRLLHDLLERIPPHPAAHGYRRGHSIVTYAAPHCGHPVVLCFDLRHFFPSVTASRVHALFRTAGYPVEVARLLTGLATNVVPDEVWRDVPRAEPTPAAWEERQRYRAPHLPQGAPTSPALANLCAYRLDCRLHGLARSLGAVYTRYADDLAFSGAEELERRARRFQVHVCRIALEEGFEVHTRKSRFMRQGVRQQLVGVVVNAHPNLRRDEYDRLKATLHNCVRFGPASQNRAGHADFRAHLLGRVAHLTMLNAARGRRLQALLERIQWP